MSTTPHWSSQANEIFLQAVQLTDAEHRMAFLADACQGDLSMRVEVEELLLANEEAGDFLEEPLSRLPEALIPPEAEPSLTHVGPYRLLEPPIGEGGMGVVYKAVQEEPVRRQVALKVIKPGLDTRQVIRRFEAERQALALMDHPNIARVLEAGATSAGRPYFVMELVLGVPITIFCDQHQLCRGDRLALFIDVCQAVQHAHQKGIIHRDLKPSNILVTAPEGRPIVKVIDFGIAKAIGENPADHTGHTASAQFIGTPLYMSPEQATLSAVDVDTRSDVYSLGVLLYELVTGTTPVHQETLRKSPDTEVRRIICEDDPPLPSQRVKTLTPEALRTLGQSEPVDAGKLSRQLAGELDWIVMQAIEKDRDRRYESASALAADVGRCLNDETVLACPPSKWYRLRKMARRNRGTLTTGVVILAALLSGTALATWQAVEANRARNHAGVLLEESQQARNQANQERYRAVESAEEARWYQYASEVQLAMRAWQRNDVRQMNEFLALNVPNTDDNELRGF
jgi:eukaryotic-like serine/threonine-protein kinase